MPILTADYSNLDHEEMAANIGLKAKHVPMLVGSFLEESTSIMQALSDAMASKDYAAMRANAHSIKGSSGNLKFNEVYEMAKEFEFAANESDAGFDYEAYYDAISKAIATIPQ